MCRMVGVVFRDQFPVGVLRDLRDVSKEGKVPGREQLGHRDGWGIASFVNGSPAYLGREPEWAADDSSYEAAMTKASELHPPSILIGHVRAASRGTAKLENTHPFIVGGLVLGHNGTIKGFHPGTKRKTRGETDSELLAYALADRYEQRHDLRNALKSVIREEVLDRDFTGVVLLVSDGKTLCGYRDYSENESYYDLRVAAGRGNTVVFQETANGIDGTVFQVRRREMVSIGLDLQVERETIR